VEGPPPGGASPAPPGVIRTRFPLLPASGHHSWRRAAALGADRRPGDLPPDRDPFV